MKRWFVFSTYYAASAVAVGAKITELGYLAWVPLERRIHRLPRAKPRIMEYSLFGPYGFCEFDATQGYSAILHCEGVRDILPTRSDPIPISTAIVEALQLAENIGLFDRTKPPKPGAKVEIINGPFAGQIGKIIKARSADRVKVALTALFGAQRIVDMPVMVLREMSNPRY